MTIDIGTWDGVDYHPYSIYLSWSVLHTYDNLRRLNLTPSPTGQVQAPDMLDRVSRAMDELGADGPADFLGQERDLQALRDLALTAVTRNIPLIVWL